MGLNTTTQRIFSLQKDEIKTDAILELGQNLGAPEAGDMTAGTLAPGPTKSKQTSPLPLIMYGL